jgi:hypothetical protein
MAGFNDWLENNVLDHYFRNQASGAPATVYLALFTSAPTDAGGGTEVTGGGYVRKAITFSAASGGVVSNSALVSWTASGASFGTVTHAALMTSVSGGNYMAWGALTASKLVNDGDTLQFPTTNVSVTLD